jgi:hypothetical protein
MSGTEMTAADMRRPAYFALYAQTMVANGFGILPVLPGQKRPRYRAWQTAGFRLPDPNWLEHHVQKYPTDSIGVGCGRVIGIDIDQIDGAKANHMQELAFAELGETSLVRIGHFPKRTLVYKTQDQIDTARFADFDLLARGSQFVAFGIHPDTRQPYYWLDASPVDTDLDDLRLIRREDLKRFVRRVSGMIGASVGRNSRAPANDNARQSVASSVRSRAAVIRNAAGLVIDHRDEFMRSLVWEEFQRGYQTPEELSFRAWARFAAEAELGRPKRGKGTRGWSHRDALSKAKYLCRRYAAAQVHPARENAQHLNSYRQSGYWSEERKARHQREAVRRGMKPAELKVNLRMLDAVPISAGQCIAPVSALIEQTGLSESSVKTARRELRKAGLWIAERGVYVPLLTTGGGANEAEPLIHSIALPADSLNQPQRDAASSDCVEGQPIQSPPEQTNGSNSADESEAKAA